MIVAAVRAVRRAAILVLRLPILAYRYAVSPLIGPSCRFYPSCSQYALEALERHGPVTGTGLAVWRLCRCHPFNEGGHDPVPPAPLALRSGHWPAALRERPAADKD